MLKWRRIQVQKYLKVHHDAKGKQVKVWIQKHTPDPWPDANVRQLNKMIQNLKSSKMDEVQWDNKKPKKISLQQQRRTQVKNFIQRNPAAKGHAIKLWLQNTKPDPQPDASVHGLNQLIARWQKKSTVKVEPQKLELTWDTNRPEDCSILKWRRTQVQKYLRANHGAKGGQVLSWLQNHEQNPWPEADTRKLNQLIGRLKVLNYKQDYEEPAGFSPLKQRRKQVENYLHENPNAKGVAVKNWLQSETPNPWPEATVGQLNKLIRRTKQSVAPKQNMPSWDNKVSTVNVFQQRRLQVLKYMDTNPNAKGWEVLEWIRDQKPDP